jgi:hypothetical protein
VCVCVGFVMCGCFGNMCTCIHSDNSIAVNNNNNFNNNNNNSQLATQGGMRSWPNLR